MEPEEPRQPELPSRTALSSMLDDLKESLGKVRENQKKVFAIRGTAWSDDRMVKAVVGPRGQLVSLELDPRIYRRPNSKALSNLIVATVRKAVDDAYEQSRGVLQDSVPSDLRPDTVGGVNVQKLTNTHDADLTLDDEEE